MFVNKIIPMEWTKYADDDSHRKGAPITLQHLVPASSSVPCNAQLTPPQHL